MEKIQEFLSTKTFAVAGASRDPDKYGNRVLRALLASGREVFPLNPAVDKVEGHRAYPSLADLPIVPESLSIVTPPAITRQIVTQAIEAGVQNIWMQPGAEDATASRSAMDAGLNVIDDGSCILVALSFERRQ